jgi:hypothetical protein
MNIDYEEFYKLYNNNLKIGVYDKLNYEFRKIYNDNVKIGDNSILKIIQRGQKA